MVFLVIYASMVKMQPIVTNNFDKIKAEFEIEMIKFILNFFERKINWINVFFSSLEQKIKLLLRLESI